MRTLDGSNAGGQFVRSALALSVLKNEPVRIEHVRGDRSTPGLRHQHLAVLETMAEICDADASGAELGAETVEFDPGLDEGEAGTGESGARPRLPGGSYAVDIGTAGSVTLLFEALLPLATILESPLSVTATGGTDVAWSPPIDYVRHVKLPLVRRYGLVAACEVDRRGFYPDGGGRATLHLAPSTLRAIDLAERGPIEGVRCYSTESTSLADSDVARRQLAGALGRLSIAGRADEPSIGEGDAEDPPTGGDDRRPPIEVVDRHERTVGSPSPGSAIVLRIDHGAGVVGFSALGERGTPAERVGEDAADAANDWLGGTAPVDRHLADQLPVLLAIAGGRVRIPAVTDHVAAGCDLLRSFGIEPTVTDDGEAAIVSIDSSTILSR